MARRRNRQDERRIAHQRMQRLLDLAHAADDPHRSGRYVALARRIGMRYQVPLPPEWRRRVCRACDTVLIAGRNARVRTHHGLVRVACLKCGNIARFPARRTSA